MTDDEARRRAERRASAKLGFYIHMAAYVVVNPLLVFINFSTNRERMWFLWPLLGWGIGLFFHWFAVFVAPALLRRLVAQELKKDHPAD